MHLELETSCIYYWHLLHIARESYHPRHLELNYYLPPAKFDFKPLGERVDREPQQKGEGEGEGMLPCRRSPGSGVCCMAAGLRMVPIPGCCWGRDGKTLGHKSQSERCPSGW